MKKILSSFLTIIALFSGCTMAPARTNNDDLLRSIQKSTVYIRADADKDHPGMHQYCSGWVLKGTHTVVTAAHCVGPNPMVDMGDGVYHPFKVDKIGDENWIIGPDLMTLISDDATIQWPTGLPVCNFKSFYGEPLVVFGAPLLMRNSMTFGLVGNPEQYDFDVTRPFIQMDGKLLEGNSGGAAVDIDNQCVMGIAEVIHLSEPKSGSEYGIGLLTPADQLQEILK